MVFSWMWSPSQSGEWVTVSKLTSGSWAYFVVHASPASDFMEEDKTPRVAAMVVGLQLKVVVHVW